MREQLVAKLRPDRFTGMSGKMAAIVGYILDERFSELDAALPPVMELNSKIGEFGRGERASASLTQQSLRFLMINRTPTESLPATARSA